MADAACDGDPSRQRVWSLRASKSFRRQAERRIDRQRRKAGDRTGRLFGRIKVFRHVATRYDE